MLPDYRIVPPCFKYIEKRHEPRRCTYFGENQARTKSNSFQYTEAVAKSNQGALTIDIDDIKFGGSKDLQKRMVRRLTEAAQAFEGERFADAFRITESINSLCPDVVEVLELRGLSAYRLSKWKEALNLLSRVERLTGELTHHAIRADCYRALGDFEAATRLWDETRKTGVGPELLEEARIVQAGALKDQGKTTEAIELLENGSKPGKNPSIFVLRRLYVLADYHESSGNLSKARSAWQQILKADRKFGDAAERLADLS